MRHLDVMYLLMCTKYLILLQGRHPHARVVTLWEEKELRHVISRSRYKFTKYSSGRCVLDMKVFVLLAAPEIL